VRSERGFALVAALWLLVALSVVGLEFGLRAHARNLAVANALETSRASGAAAAGLSDAQALLARLAREPSVLGAADPNRLVDPWAGVAGYLGETSTIGASRYRVNCRDANAALHLNRATEDELRRLFVGLRVDFGAADRLAQAIMDWRDADDLHRARGAERADYLQAGLAAVPADRPFDRLSDLRHVMGMTPEIYRLVRPHLTLLGTGQVNLNAASRPVLLALPGMSEQAVGLLLRRSGGSRPVRTLAELGNDLSTAPRKALQDHFAELSTRAVFETREVIATADGWTDGSPVHVTATGLFVRAGPNAVMLWRSER
jgi:general secretion pathway protein K